MSKALKKNVFILLILLLTLLFFYKQILNPDKMIYSDLSDIVNIQGSYKILKYETFTKYLTIPLWNPFSLGDGTAVGSVVVALFYPISIPEYFINPHLVAGYQFMIHIFLFGLFVYFYMRALKVKRFSAFISAIIAMFAGRIIMFVYSGQTNQIAFIWIPLIFLFFELSIRKKSYFYSILTGAAIAVQFSGLHSQFFLYTMFSLFLYFLYRSFLNIKKKNILRSFLEYSKYFVTVMVFFFLIASIQILPLIEAIQFNDRSGGVDWNWATDHSIPPTHIIKFIFPNFFGSSLNHTYWGAPNFWESTGYLGVTALILCLFALLFKRNKHVLFFSGLAVFSIIFSFGKYTPLFSFFYHFIPFFNMFRVPTRMLAVYSFSISIIAGFGAEFLLSKISKEQRKRLIKIAKALIIITISGLIISLFITIKKEKFISFGEKLALKKYNEFVLPPNEGLSSRPLSYYLQNVRLVFNGLLKDIFISLSALISFIFLIILILNRKLKHHYLKIFLTIIILFELWSFGLPLIDVVDPNELYAKNNFINFLLQDTSMYRVTQTEDGSLLPPYHSVNYGIVHIDGFYSVVTKRYMNVINEFIQDRGIQEKNHKLLDLFNTKYIITEKTTNNPRYELVYNGTNQVFDRIEKEIKVRENVYIYKNKNALPRAFIVHNAKVIRDEDEILNTLWYDKGFNPRDYIIIEKDIDKPLNNEGNFSEAKISFYSPNKLIIEAYLDNPGFLVLSEMWYPGWKAFEVNKEHKIYQTNYLFRSIYLDKGYHKIIFVFDPLSLRIGLWITLITIILLIIMVVYKVKRTFFR